MEFILGDLQSTPVGLRQQFLLMGDGFGIKFNPEPGLLLHIDAALRVAGAELVASNPPFVWFYLHKNSTFELLTRQADAKFTAVDITRTHCELSWRLGHRPWLKSVSIGPSHRHLRRTALPRRETRTVRFIGICRCVGIRQIAGAGSNFYLAVRVSGIPRQKSVDSQNRFYARPVG
jgi:hypothetical protein